MSTTEYVREVRRIAIIAEELSELLASADNAPSVNIREDILTMAATRANAMRLAADTAVRLKREADAALGTTPDGSVPVDKAA